MIVFSWNLEFSTISLSNLQAQATPIYVRFHVATCWRERLLSLGFFSPNTSNIHHPEYVRIELTSNPVGLVGEGVDVASMPTKPETIIVRKSARRHSP